MAGKSNPQKAKNAGSARGQDGEEKKDPTPGRNNLPQPQATSKPFKRKKGRRRGKAFQKEEKNLSHHEKSGEKAKTRGNQGHSKPPNFISTSNGGKNNFGVHAKERGLIWEKARNWTPRGEGDTFSPDKKRSRKKKDIYGKKT